MYLFSVNSKNTRSFNEKVMYCIPYKHKDGIHISGKLIRKLIISYLLHAHTRSHVMHSFLDKYKYKRTLCKLVLHTDNHNNN